MKTPPTLSAGHRGTESSNPFPSTAGAGTNVGGVLGPAERPPVCDRSAWAIVSRGAWHRFQSPGGMTMMTVAPRPRISSERGNGQGRSFFRHPSLAQPGEIGRFKQSTDLRPGASALVAGQRQLELSDARVVGVQSLCFAKLGHCLFRFAMKSVGGS